MPLWPHIIGLVPTLERAVLGRPTIAAAGVWAAVTTATACDYAGHVAGAVGLESLSVHSSMWISQRLPRAKLFLTITR